MKKSKFLDPWRKKTQKLQSLLGKPAKILGIQINTTKAILG